MYHHSQKSAFTLVELAIVIVIVGLLVAGVVGAQSLIKSAQRSSEISQFSKFDQGAAAFKLEYDALPGDIKRADAISYGFSVDYQSQIYTNMHNGDNIILPGANYLGSTDFWGYQTRGEPAYFFYHMQQAKIYEGGLIDYSTSVTYMNDFREGVIYPMSKIAVGGIVPLSARNGDLYYLAGTVSSRSTTYNDTLLYKYTEFPPFLTRDILAIDKKADDGLPTTGKIMAVARPTNQGESVRINRDIDNCVTTSSGNYIYDLSYTSPACMYVVMSNVK